MKQKLFWIALAFILCGALRLVYDPLEPPREATSDARQAVSLSIKDLPPLIYYEVK